MFLANITYSFVHQKVHDQAWQIYIGNEGVQSNLLDARLDVKSLRTKLEGFQQFHEEEGTKREDGMSWNVEECCKERKIFEGQVIKKLEGVFHIKLRYEWKMEELERESILAKW